MALDASVLNAIALFEEYILAKGGTNDSHIFGESLEISCKSLRIRIDQGEMEMSEVKDQIIELITDGDLSSLQIISGRLGISEEETLTLVEELVSEGKLSGKITDDGKRFFKDEVELSTKPVMKKEERRRPRFLEFDSRPAIRISCSGFILVIIGMIGYFSTPPTDVFAVNMWTVAMLLSIIATLSGCYYIGAQKTP